jgi:hypothetical protein
MSLPQSHEGTMPGRDRVVEPVTPLPKLTSNTLSEVVAAPSQAQDIPLGSNIKREAHAYLISGEDSNSSSMYVPSHGSKLMGLFITKYIHLCIVRTIISEDD